MWAISQGNPAMEIAYFERMGLNGLSSNPLILLEGQVVERERRKQPIGACPITFSLPHFPFYPLCFPLLSISFLIPIFPLFFFIFLSCQFSHLFFLTFYLPLFVLVVAYCTQLRPFCTACHEEFYYFTPQLLLARFGCPSQTTHQFVSCLAVTTTLCQPCHIPFLDKRVLFCFLTFHRIPIKIRVGSSLLLTPMVCTK